MRHHECVQTVDAYLRQMSSDFEVYQLDDGCFVSTPFVRPDGEAIEVQLEAHRDNQVRLSDMGDSLGYLYANGLTLSKSVMESAHRISGGFGVTLSRNTLVVDTDDESIGDALHRLIQTTIAVTGLIQKRRPRTRVRFDDEVESLIIHSGATYDIGFRVQGQRQQHIMKFHVDSGRNLLVHPVSAATEASAQSWAERVAYRFTDIRERSDRWRLTSVLDDRGQRARVWTASALVPIEEYAIRWSEKDRLEELVGAKSQSQAPSG